MAGPPKFDMKAYDDASAKLDEVGQRLFWTGGAANGALLLALLNLAAKASVPAEELQNLTPAVSLCMIGFAAGAYSITSAMAAQVHRLGEALARGKLDFAMARAGIYAEILTNPPMNTETARLIHGDDADQKMRALLYERLKGAQEAWDQAPAVSDAALDEMKLASKMMSEHLVRARTGLIVSFVSAGAALTAILARAWWPTLAAAVSNLNI